MSGVVLWLAFMLAPSESDLAANRALVRASCPDPTHPTLRMGPTETTCCTNGWGSCVGKRKRARPADNFCLSNGNPFGTQLLIEADGTWWCCERGGGQCGN